MNVRNGLGPAGALLLIIALAGGAQAGRGDLERNKQVVRRVFEDVLTQGRIEVERAIHTPDFVAHAGDRSAGLEEDIAAAQGWRDAFPDLVVTVEQLIAEGDRVAAFWTARGTNTGEGHGLPATGRSGAAQGITIFRLVGGRIAEEWNVMDQYGMLKQLGLLPK